MEIKNNTDIEKTNMENYKVILVDDEEEVIDAIKSRILWEQLGLQIVGSATNGVKALELVEKLQPDIVITDIKMPYMNGLELSRRLNDEYRNVHIIIFTGFDEFDYAKEAVHLEIDEYMLKPINAVELSECLKRVKNSLDKEREEKLNVQKLENYFDDVLPIIQTNFFVSLIEGRVNESEYEKFLQAYKIDLKGPYFCCAVFHTSENNVPEEMSPLLLSMSVEREIKARIVEKFKCREFIYLGNTVLIIELKSKEETVELTDVCDKFCKWVNRVIGAGRTEVMRTLIGADQRTSGKIILKGKEVKNGWNTTKALKAGIGLLPEDRKTQGFMNLSNNYENIAISSLEKYMTGPFTDTKKKIKNAEVYFEEMDVHPRRVDYMTSNMSGGNQQKVILARWMSTDVDIIIFDEPTKGVDVGAKAEIYRLMEQLVEDGKSIIVVSSELPEAMGISDRMIIMSEGRITAELTNKVDFVEDSILDLAIGGN